jgi:hypothetical protein
VKLDVKNKIVLFTDIVEYCNDEMGVVCSHANKRITRSSVLTCGYNCKLAKRVRDSYKNDSDYSTKKLKVIKHKSASASGLLPHKFTLDQGVSVQVQQVECPGYTFKALIIRKTVNGKNYFFELPTSSVKHLQMALNVLSK